MAKDYKVVIITSKVRETNLKLNKDITILKWPSKRPTGWKDFWFLCKLTKMYKPTMMISLFGSVNLFLIVGGLFRVKNRVTWIRTLSSQYSQNKFKVFRKILVYKLATKIITNSIATKKDVISFFNISEHKITVLPNSVKDYSNSLQDVTTDKYKLLYVGRLHASKGIDVLIRAFSQIIKKFPYLKLEIIGDGDTLNELIELTELLGVIKNVLFLGAKNKELVLKAYKESYCTIIPSHSEAFGFTVIEAMSVGTCVVGANNTGIKEIIIHGETGLLFETGNWEELAEKLEELIQDVTYRNSLAQAGYTRFINYYENSVAINRDIEFFKKL